jgi:2-haloacid dehalogenase
VKPPRFLRKKPGGWAVTKYRYLTFDCYGTLIDWRTGIERALRSALGDIQIGGQELMAAYLDAEKRQEAHYKRYREVLKDSVMALSGRLGTGVTEAAGAEFAASVPKWPAFPDSAKFLREMGERGYKRYILSNVDDDLLGGTIGNSQLAVDGFVTAEQVGSYKPNHAHWLKFMLSTGAAKEEVLHIAQSIYHDILPAQDLGMASAWVNRYNEPMPPGASPQYVADSLDHLAQTLD